MKSKPSSFTRFLWWTAGADQEILLRSTHSDRVKYMTLGGIILATGIMAALAGGYAFYTIFSPKGDALHAYKEVANSVDTIRETTHRPTALLSFLFGLLWGLMIFNIDRFIVTSTGTGDGTERITWSEFKGAIPRIIMGAVIAVTISKPVEIRMFKSEIDAELHMQQKKQEAQYAAETRSKYQVDFDRIDQELEKIEHKKKRLRDELSRLEKEYTDQVQGKKAAGAGVGPLARALKDEMIRKENQIKQFDSKFEPDQVKFTTEREKLQAQLNEDLKNNKVVASGLDGLLERIKIAHEIAGTWITLFITLLFLVIELTPIFFKLMLIKSPYDYLLENEKELAKARAGIHVEYNYYSEDEHPELDGVERHLVRFLDHERLKLEKIEMLEAQKRLTRYAIRKFEDQQKAMIDKNPEKYIQMSNTESEDEDKSSQ